MWPGTQGYVARYLEEFFPYDLVLLHLLEQHRHDLPSRINYTQPHSWNTVLNKRFFAFDFAVSGLTTEQRLSNRSGYKSYGNSLGIFASLIRSHASRYLQVPDT